MFSGLIFSMMMIIMVKLGFIAELIGVFIGAGCFLVSWELYLERKFDEWLNK